MVYSLCFVELKSEIPVMVTTFVELAADCHLDATFFDILDSRIPKKFVENVTVNY